MAEIVINFRIEGGDGNLSQDLSPTPETSSPEQAKDKKKEAWIVAHGLDVAKQLGRQVADQYIASIGSRTGNYVQQEQIQTAIGIGTKAVGIATSFAANVWLGVAHLAAEGISTGFQLANYQRELRWQNREAAELRRRAGYNSNYNR